MNNEVNPDVETRIERTFGESLKYYTHGPGLVITRNLIAFWLFGLCNNFGYVVMLSAAEDILSSESNGTTDTDQFHSVGEGVHQRNCTLMSTGAVLLADILPCFLVKLTAPLYMMYIPFGPRVALTILLGLSSFIVTAFSKKVWLSLFGVVLGSFGSGLGELTFLAMMAHYHSAMVTSWSSGTGGAGILGSFAYALLTTWMSERASMLFMTIVPVLFAIAYWILLVQPDSMQKVHILKPETYIIHKSKDSDDDPLHKGETLPLKLKLKLIVPLLKYMIPLGLVYMGEYFINQGLTQLLVFDNGEWPQDYSAQYRWYQALYQLGVFLSRSSTVLFSIPTKFLPILSLLQLTNALLFFFDAFYVFIPYIYIIFCLIFYEGLLGGFAYVNTFDHIRKEAAPEYREYSLGVASVADSCGILIAGFFAIPAHNFICKRPIP